MKDDDDEDEDAEPKEEPEEEEVAEEESEEESESEESEDETDSESSESEAEVRYFPKMKNINIYKTIFSPLRAGFSGRGEESQLRSTYQTTWRTTGGPQEGQLPGAGQCGSIAGWN